MEEAALVLIVSPLMGHLTQSLELSKLILQRSNHISIEVLIMKVPTDPEGTAKIQSLVAATDVEHLHFHHLPTPEDTSKWSTTNKGTFLHQLINYQKPHIRNLVSNIKGLSGLIIDLMNTTMIDIADELGVPTYVFLTSGAAFLGLVLHFQTVQDEHNLELPELFDISNELHIPCFSNPVPRNVLPTITTNKETWSVRTLNYARGYRKAKGIMVNTFGELEAFALNSFLNDSFYKSRLPPIYPVGPILKRFETRTKNSRDTIEWLDGQQENSVVFLCFGSMGSFNLDQVKEIADGLERSGHRFLWVLRQAPANKGGFPGEFEDHGLVLPEGFLDRTASIGKVVGWVPQLAVLSHPAVGGFVSHCGWNSTLESIWCGVPIATWPLFGEQQLNAFQLVKELGIAVEITLDYNEANEHQPLVRAEQIEKGIRELMDGANEVRRRVKEFSDKSRLAMKEGGSSYLSFDNVIQNICSNHP
ncbi:hypothetical protein ACH5RR_028945 [Cinchona calisaya]|uniref:Glycosyltransferase n=1 Tax=Cinchona calisaya TaxID=153742 RepID=A0ABD2YTR8_9GENT